MLKQRQHHLNFFTEQIVTTAFSEMNLSRWETYMMGLISIRNKSFLSSSKVIHLAWGHWHLSPTGVTCVTSQVPHSPKQLYCSQIVGCGTACVPFQYLDSVLTAPNLLTSFGFRRGQGDKNSSGGKTQGSLEMTEWGWKTRGLRCHLLPRPCIPSLVSFLLLSLHVPCQMISWSRKVESSPLWPHLAIVPGSASSCPETLLEEREGSHKLGLIIFSCVYVAPFTRDIIFPSSALYSQPKGVFWTFWIFPTQWKL